MKILKSIFFGLIAGAALLIASQGVSSASQSSAPKSTLQVVSNFNDQRVAYTIYYRPKCYKVKRCVRVNRYGNCKRWKWVTVCPGRRI